MSPMPVLRRLVSTVLAVFLLALGAFFVAQAIPQLRGNNRPLWVNYYIVTRELSQRAWSDPYVLGAGGVLLLLGLALLALATRGGPRPLRLASTTERLRVDMPVKQLRRVAETAAFTVDGVTAAKAQARKRRVRVTVVTYPQAPADLDSRVKNQVGRSLNALAPARRRPRVRVRVKRRGR